MISGWQEELDGSDRLVSMAAAFYALSIMKLINARLSGRVAPRTLLIIG